MSDIKRIHLLFKTHLDLGFTELARDVAARYFSDFIPRALDTAQALRRSGRPERFCWTMGSWLVHEHLERAAQDERRRMEEAILAGDIAWHGLPFTMHSELMDASLFAFGLRLSGELDRRFGKRTIAAKMTDVPGHTRGIVPQLAAAGIELLHIGVNGASTPPEVPPVFVWRAPGGAEIIVIYQRGSYGDLTAVEGLPDALAFAHTNDNVGPQGVEQVLESHRQLRARFPGAEVSASTLDAFAAALLTIKHRLPVVTGEIGDTWIHGAGTDPKKVSQFRELCRLRREWEAAGATPEDRGFAALSRALLLIPEHTWGLDEKTHLADRESYEASRFQAARAEEKFKRFEASWAEQRAYVQAAVEALGASPWAGEAARRLAGIEPARPDRAGFTPAPDPSALFETEHFKVRFNARGAMTTLIDAATGRDWASPEHALALFRYEIFSQEDYDRFWRQYIINKRQTAAWSRDDFTKPGIEGVVKEPRSWLSERSGLHLRRDEAGDRFLLDLRAPAESSAAYGCPREICLEASFPRRAPIVDLTLQWFDKPACRLPEALWLSFTPEAPAAGGWRMDKMGQLISPHEVVRNGNRTLHGVGAGVSYVDQSGRFMLETLDAPLVAPGAPSLLRFSNKRPALRGGMHVNLYNNVWGTNFPMWYEDDARFRFTLRFGPRGPSVGTGADENSPP